MRLRPLTEEESTDLRALAHGQNVEAGRRDRARSCGRAHDGKRVRESITLVGIGEHTVRRWITRFTAQGLAGLADAPRIGRPPTSTAEEIGVVIATSLIPPDAVGLPFGSWTLDRLAAYLQEERGMAIKRSRIGELLPAEGLRGRTQEAWSGERVDPAFAETRGRSSPSTKHRLTGVS